MCEIYNVLFFGLNQLFVFFNACYRVFQFDDIFCFLVQPAVFYYLFMFNFTSLYCITIVRPIIPREYGQTRWLQTNKTLDFIQDNGQRQIVLTILKLSCQQQLQNSYVKFSRNIVNVLNDLKIPSKILCTPRSPENLELSKIGSLGNPQGKIKYCVQSCSPRKIKYSYSRPDILNFLCPRSNTVK